MAWEDASEGVVVSTGAVYFAPVGTTLPAEKADPVAALDPAFVGAGFLSEDGISPSVGSEVTDFMALQSLQPIRREKTAQDISFAFSLLQWNESNVPFAFGGGSVEEGTGVWCYSFAAAGDALDEWSLVVDVQDGDDHYRFVFPRGNVTETIDSQFQRAAMAALPITFKVLEPEGGGKPGYFNTDAAGFAAGS